MFIINVVKRSKIEGSMEAPETIEREFCGH